VGHRAPTYDLIRKANAGVMKSRTLDGVPVYLAFDVLPTYHWAVTVAVPVEEVTGPARRSLFVWLGVTAMLVTAAVVFALRVARGVARPVEGLAQAAGDWVQGHPVIMPPHSGLPEIDSLGAAFGRALAVVDARDSQQRLLINELNHRVKNTLATVQSIALHSRRASAAPDAFHSAFEGRLMAMSGAHDLLTRTAWESAALEDVINTALRPFLGPRVSISGPHLQIDPTTALNLSLIIYELATNAAKHGALSNDAGQVALSWRRIGEKAEVIWIEAGGPPTAPPAHKGFGSRLIERAARDLQPAGLDFMPGGVRCKLTIDLASAGTARAFILPAAV
jgi:two-component sensor histidine kinase